MKSKIDFGVVAQSHVEVACQRVIRDGVPQNRSGRSTFIRFDDQILPAKYVVGLAYQIATGDLLNPDDYHGGVNCIRVLEKLGFTVIHTAPTKAPYRRPVPPPHERNEAISDNRREVKARLFTELQRRFGDVETEKKFPWLVVPKRNEVPYDIRKIRDALISPNGYLEFDTPGFHLQCDFFLPAHSVIIEVDERQHFTKARALALQNYPPGIVLGFCRENWIDECKRIRAAMPTRPHRDEQRAYYDSLRDLLASGNGMKPIVRLILTCLKDSDSMARAITHIENIAYGANPGKRVNGPTVSRTA